MDDASLLQTKLTQAQVDELGQRLAEADVAFGSVKPAAGGEFSGGGGRNLVSYGNRAAAAVWLARGKGSKSAAIAACRADQSAKQVGGNCALVDKRIESVCCRCALVRAHASCVRRSFVNLTMQLELPCGRRTRRAHIKGSISHLPTKSPSPPCPRMHAGCWSLQFTAPAA